MSWQSYTPAQDLLAAARDVLANWEKGDLAGAMRDLQSAVNSIDDDIAALEGNPVTATAAGLYEKENIKVDPDPFLAPSETGTWVSAWVYVPTS